MYVYRRRVCTIAQLVLDICSFWPIWEITTRIRVALNPLTQKQLSNAANATGWVAPVGFILLLYVITSFHFRLYKLPKEITVWTIGSWAAENAIAVCSVSIFAAYFSRHFGSDTSRIFIVCLLPVSFIVFAITRLILLSSVAFIQRSSGGPRVAVIGDVSKASDLIAGLKSEIGTAIRGVILPEGASFPVEMDHQFPILGTTSQIAELVNTEGLDRFIVINDSIPESELARCNNIFWRMGLPVSSTLSLAAGALSSGSSAPRIQVSKMNGLRVVNVQPTSTSSIQDSVKRLLDVIGSLGMMLVLTPVMLFVAVLVKASSKGPVLEKAPRVGKGGRHFTCLKFRTTLDDLNQPAPPLYWNTFTPDGHQVTQLGTILRRYSLDELPQLFNVLVGDMSFVGPRPLPAHHLGPDGMSREFFDWSAIRAKVRPGLTGLWQVCGRNNLPFHRMIELDLEYITNRSLALDLSVLLETPFAVISGVGAD